MNVQTTLSHEKNITNLDYAFRDEMLKFHWAGKELELRGINVVCNHPVMLKVAAEHHFTDVVCKR